MLGAGDSLGRDGNTTVAFEEHGGGHAEHGEHQDGNAKPALEAAPAPPIPNNILAQSCHSILLIAAPSCAPRARNEPLPASWKRTGLRPYSVSAPTSLFAYNDGAADLVSQ